uniref:TIL domain-containing protein n=1 Tax=Caenorhabditis japonica TaxID=281687 RepID=A0A8R1DRL9_CAEJA
MKVLQFVLVTFFTVSGLANWIRPVNSLPMCGKNQKRVMCSYGCEQQCGWSPNICSLNCVPNVCVCKHGYVRNIFDECVHWNACTPETSRCPEDEEFKVCGTYCEPSCDDDESSLTDCDETECARNVCRCKPGFVRLDGVCVLPSECPAKRSRPAQLFTLE